MSKYPHPIIAVEGIPFVIVLLVASVMVGTFFGWWSLPLWLATLFVLQFFRDPPRVIPQEEGLVLCPADGRVIVVGDAPDPYRGGAASVKVSIFMNVFNVHSQRAPVDCVVKDVQYAKGLFVAGLIARRILCYVHAGERLTRGQRYGFIRFGSRVDVYLPPGSRPRVAIGDKVKASSTVLAELPR